MNDSGGQKEEKSMMNFTAKNVHNMSLVMKYFVCSCTVTDSRKNTIKLNVNVFSSKCLDYCVANVCICHLHSLAVKNQHCSLLFKANLNKASEQNLTM